VRRVDIFLWRGIMRGREQNKSKKRARMEEMWEEEE